MQPLRAQAKRLGLSTAQACDAIGITPSHWYQCCKKNQTSKLMALAMEALVRRQSREATGWALLELNHGSAKVTPIAEPQEITLKGQAFWLVVKPGES
jgi:hypothetical protein